MKWEVGQVDGFLTFKCKSNGRYLDGKTEAGSTTVLMDRVPKGDNFLQWSIEPVFMPGQRVYLKSKKSYCYLESSKDSGS